MWVTNPSNFFDVVWNFFSSKFDEPMYDTPKLVSSKFKKLSESDSDMFVAPIMEAEIKDDVWGCGGDKASSPDGFTFKFIKHY